MPVPAGTAEPRAEGHRRADRTVRLSFSGAFCSMRSRAGLNKPRFLPKDICHAIVKKLSFSSVPCEIPSQPTGASITWILQNVDNLETTVTRLIVTV